MESRVAIVSIILDKPDAVGPLNEILHQYREYIIGRMGIPYREKAINIICVALDAPVNVINSLAGSLGRVSGISAKAICTKVEESCG